MEPRSGLFARVAGENVSILNVFRRRDLDLADVIPLQSCEHKGQAVHKAGGISKQRLTSYKVSKPLHIATQILYLYSALVPLLFTLYVVKKNASTGALVLARPEARLAECRSVAKSVLSSISLGFRALQGTQCRGASLLFAQRDDFPDSEASVPAKETKRM